MTAERSFVVRMASPKSAAEHVPALDRLCFPYDEPVEMQVEDHWWLVWEAGEPVAFAGATYYAPDDCVYLCRAGVTHEARGQGLQRRLIRARLNWAKAQGARGCYTYTVVDNVWSANNLIAEGFVSFRPAVEWGGANVNYWKVKL